MVFFVIHPGAPTQVQWINLPPHSPRSVAKPEVSTDFGVETGNAFVSTHHKRPQQRGNVEVH